MMPVDFDPVDQDIKILEEELKQEGFSYFGGINLIKEMYEVMSKLNPLTTPDGKREVHMTVNSEDAFSWLSILKYPNRELEEQIEQYDIDSAFTETPRKIIIKIKIDDKMGIYRIDKPELRYPLGKSKKRMKLIKYLILHEHAGLKALMTATNQEKSAVITSITAINDMIQKKLETRHDFILHLETGGYSINKEDFEIK